MNNRRSTGARMLAEQLQTLVGHSDQTPYAPSLMTTRGISIGSAPTGQSLPIYIEHTLGRLHLLSGVPFNYLVPDSHLLPDESIRFFIVDPEWIDMLIQGVLATGSGSFEQAMARIALPRARLAATRQVPFVRDIARGRLTLEVTITKASEDSSTQRTISGFLLRSELVSGWPGMNVRAWASDDLNSIPLCADPATVAKDHPEFVVHLLRLERLSPSILIALFDGIPRLIWLEEPHHSVQFGFNKTDAEWTLDLRNDNGMHTGSHVPVPLRTGAVNGVVDIDLLTQTLGLGSAALALQLIRSPIRQRFTAATAEQLSDGHVRG